MGLSKKLRRATRRSTRPTPLLDRWIIPVALLAMAVAMAIVHLTHAYTSDDTAPLVVMQQWVQGMHGATYFGSDSFIIKFPLYWVMQELLPHSRTALFLIVLVINLAGLWLFAVAARYFLKKLQAYSSLSFGLSILWLATLGIPFLTILMVPHGRNLEIGLAFYLLMWVDKGLEGGRPYYRRFVPAVAGMSVTAGLFIYNDPYFLITALVPLLVVLAARLAVRFDRRTAIVLGGTVASYGLYKAFNAGFEHAGIVASTGDARFISPAQLVPQLVSLLQNTLDLFRGNFFGLLFFSSLAIVALVSCVIVWLVVRTAWQTVRRPSSTHWWWELFFGLQFFIVAAAFVLSSYSSASATRYLILLPFSGVMFLGIAYSRLKDQRLRRGLLALLLVVSVLHVGVLLRDTYHARHNPRPNADNRVIIDLLESHGLAKGYAHYWSANINTYLSNGALNINPVRCNGATTSPYYWLMDSAALTKPADRSFYLYDDDPAEPSCSFDDVVAQFGEPSEIIGVNDSMQLLIFPYDIKSRM